MLSNEWKLSHFVPEVHNNNNNNKQFTRKKRGDRCPGWDTHRHVGVGGGPQAVGEGHALAADDGGVGGVGEVPQFQQLTDDDEPGVVGQGQEGWSGEGEDGGCALLREAKKGLKTLKK